MFTLQAGSNGSIQSNHNVCRFFVLAEALEMPNRGFNIEYQIQIESAPLYSGNKVRNEHLNILCQNLNSK